MTPIGRALMGILTTMVFLVIGVSILEPSPRWGWFIILLGVIRGGYALYQLIGLFRPGSDDDEVA